MTKKILLGLFILLMGAASIIAYSFYKNIKRPISKTTFEAIPLNAALIIKENNFSALYKKLNTTNIIWEELITNTETAQKTNNQLHYFDSLLKDPFKNLFLNKTILGSLHLSGANNFDFIYYLSINSEITEEKLISQLKNVIKKPVSSRNYDGVSIYSINSNTDDKISLTVYKNTIAFSSSGTLIEDVVRQLNSKISLLNDNNFATLIANSGQSKDGNLLLNSKYFSKIINQYLNKSNKKYSSKLENYTGWTELDINIKANTLSCNGFSFSDNNSDHFLTLFKDQKPQDLDMLSIIPSNVACIYHYGLSDSKLFFDSRKLSLKNNNRYYKHQQYLDEQTEKYGIDLEEELLANIGNEIALIIMESLSDDFSEKKFIIFHSSEIEKAATDLSNISKKVNPESFEIISFNNYQINKIGLKNLFSNLFGKPFTNLDHNFYTIIDDYVVFGNSTSALEHFIKNVINKKVLTTDENFKTFNDNISSTSNIFIYNNAARSINLYKQFCKDDYLPIIDDKIETFRKFEAISFQVSTEKNGLYYNNIHLKYNPIYKKETSSLWELLLDTTITSAPQLVINHKTKAKEIFIQDDAHKVYLVNNLGKVIWTKQLQEEIIGKVHQIDVYKNNKLQLLFNTKSKIYLIDRNGNNVENYPVKLQSIAVNGVTPLDYSNNKNYRLIVGCEDNMIYNFNTKGSPVKGWNYSPESSPANGKIWHFSQSGKDYIVAPLKDGKIKIIQRNGEDRLNLKNEIPLNSNQAYLKISNELSKTYLVSVDSTGSISKLFLNDKKEVLNSKNVLENFRFNFFDFNNDRSYDYIFAHDNILRVYDNDQNIIIKKTMSKKITQTPTLFKADNNYRIGLVTEDEIYLINDKGEIEDGFPLAGSTPFSISDINNDKTVNLVVSHKNMLYTYNLK